MVIVILCQHLLKFKGFKVGRTRKFVYHSRQNILHVVFLLTKESKGKNLSSSTPDTSKNFKSFLKLATEKNRTFVL